ncbi:DUF2189 domain-containing protein [Sedimenticola selenatireducens]|uniref:DUF2189 domain-containing protein n=1 Tax=Sedimenticola selenatireducens TaxID=191960 RepID=A0A557SD18_9GAMM|nr:DUF2189 domain-containing protein [Sedimenticola selenatireducens]TVO75310.1 DUF2189 domain-containing protein [Sedimenticola selenatireducens]TVT66837.1 MAG: DUF2189 domain-containing protein [Sedimenticola selenatireducens]
MFSVVWEWLCRGWQDFRRAPVLNMAYAAVFLAIGLIAVLGLITEGFSLVYFILAGGFLLVVPSLVTVYYHLAGIIHAGQHPNFADIKEAFHQCPAAVLVIGLVSLVLYLIWITDALIIYSVYFDFVPISLADFNADPVLKADATAFLIFACILGAVLSFIIFCITVLSIPFALEKKSGLVDAVTFSVKVVSRNPRIMFMWAILLGGLTFFTVLLALPLLLVVLPVLAYANYATYNDMLRLMESG